jgi:hypothetical protein
VRLNERLGHAADEHEETASKGHSTEDRHVVPRSGVVRPVPLVVFSEPPELCHTARDTRAPRRALPYRSSRPVATRTATRAELPASRVELPLVLRPPLPVSLRVRTPSRGAAQSRVGVGVGGA